MWGDDMRQLYDYFRSSAAYRVRIVLQLKGLSYESINVSLLDNVHQSTRYTRYNPQGLVPTLVEDDGVMLTQSLAICEYLDEIYPVPPILPWDAVSRARVRALAQTIACDIHPLNNLRVLRYLEQNLGLSAAKKITWYHHWVIAGFDALELQLQQTRGEYCYGDVVTLADVCLVPQVYNALRFHCDMTSYPTIMEISNNCLNQYAFLNASPEHNFNLREGL